MRLNKILMLSLFLSAVFISCEKDNGNEPIPVRDRGEQEEKDRQALEAYLATHFYNYEDFENPPPDFDNVIEFDTISGENADKIPLIESDLLETKSFTMDDVEYTLYILKIREGVGEAPTFADSTFITYEGEFLSGVTFDNSVNPVWFDLTGIVPGLTQALTEFKGSSGFSVNFDNTVTWNNDYGIGAVFMPSGLAYFNSNPSSPIPPYSPLIFGFNLYKVNQADHDQDGIPSYMEDINGDQLVDNDDTDKDNRNNFRDPDDDNDFIPTREEIVIKEDGSIEFTDSDADGTPDYLESAI